MDKPKEEGSWVIPAIAGAIGGVVMFLLMASADEPIGNGRKATAIRALFGETGANIMAGVGAFFLIYMLVEWIMKRSR
jgi:hypothetical protein